MLPVLSKRKISALCTVYALRKNKRKQDLDEAIIFGKELFLKKSHSTVFVMKNYEEDLSHI